MSLMSLLDIVQNGRYTIVRGKPLIGSQTIMFKL